MFLAFYSNPKPRGLGADILDIPDSFTQASLTSHTTLPYTADLLRFL